MEGALFLLYCDLCDAQIGRFLSIKTFIKDIRIARAAIGDNVFISNFSCFHNGTPLLPPPREDLSAERSIAHPWGGLQAA